MLSVTYFINKLFSTQETLEITEVDTILQNIKAALIYKGLDFSVIFAENTVENVKKSRKSVNLDNSNLDDSTMLQKKIKDQPIDLT